MKKTILLVEDEEELRELLANELRDFDFGVIEAKNGREAVQILASQSVDIVVTDLRMPECDGLELLSHIRKTIGSSVRTVLMSGFADCTQSQAQTFGANELLHKPFSLQQFVETIENLLKTPQPVI